MGWFEVPDKEGCILGDEALDETYDYLNRISKLYMEDLERLCTLQELGEMMSIVLSIGTDNLVGLSKRRETTRISVSAPSKRMTPQECREGSLFVVPLAEYGLISGRILRDELPLGVVAEFLSPTDASHPRLFPPLLISSAMAFDSGRWKIVRQSDTSNVEAHIRFFCGDDSIGYRIWENGDERPATAEEIKGLEEMEIWAPQKVERRIRAYLAAGSVTN